MIFTQYFIILGLQFWKMKQLILLAIATVLLASCEKHATCTCSAPGMQPHVISGYNEATCLDYETKSPDRDCVFED